LIENFDANYIFEYIFCIAAETFENLLKLTEMAKAKKVEIHAAGGADSLQGRPAGWRY